MVSLTHALKRLHAPLWIHARFRTPAVIAYLWLLAALGAAALIAWELQGLVPEESLAMVFLSAILISSIAYGRAMGIISALLGFLTFNILFLDPRFKLTFSPLSDTLTLSVFLGLALLTGTLAGRVRDQAQETARRASRMTLLFRASRELGSAVDRDVLAGILAREVAQAVHGSVHVFLSRDGGIACAASAATPRDGSGLVSATDPVPGVVAFAERAWAHASATGFDGALREAPYLAYPLGTVRQPIGLVIRAHTEAAADPIVDDQTMTILCELGAIAMERAHLMEEMTKAELTVETDRLRTALLSSISHDFRTPLSGILASVTALIEQGPQFSPETARELLGDIRDQSERINRYVANLLDMIRLEAGAIRLRMEPTDALDIVGTAARRCKQLGARDLGWLEIEAERSCLVDVDPVLLEQAIYNVLDNARLYTASSAPIRVTLNADGDAAEIVIADSGPGIPAGELERVFDKFYRVSALQNAIPGTGLGLSISRGLIEAMGGTVHAVSPVKGGRGTAIHIRLKPSFEAQE